MSLLTPLGLLGLLSIVALIIIYIIRPNYQEKFISTTFVWNLSLKYRKKRIPTSKLRNILLIICQILILLLATTILTTPSEVIKAQIEEPEIIIILDSSASMRTTYVSDYDGEERTRFMRAIEKSKQKADETFELDGTVSLIIADESPEFVLTGIKKDTRSLLDEKFNELIEKDVCAYGKSDLEEAIDICADIFDENPSAQIFVYTDGTYASLPTGGITVVDVGDAREWNAAILSAEPEKVNGNYTVIGQVACYNRSEEITVSVSVYDINGVFGNDVNTEFTVDCMQDVPVTFILASLSDAEEENPVHISYLENYNTTDPNRDDYVVVCDIGKVPSYSSVNLNLVVDDNLKQDDNFSIYGGELEEINVEYASSLHNRFVSIALGSLSDFYREKGMWDFVPYERSSEKMTTEGFDYYIFEHIMPETMPQDGFVFIMDPDNAPVGAGFDVAGTVDLNKVSVDLVSGEEHFITSDVTIEDITISRFQKLVNVDPEYKVLAEFDGNPMIMVKEDGSTKVVVMAFSVHYTNFQMLFTAWTYFFYDIFEYFNPVTVKANYFEIGEDVSINARGETLTIAGNEVNVELTSYEGAEEQIEFPTTWVFYTPGTYTLSQETDYGKSVQERIFVKAPASESDIFELKNTLVNPYGTVEISDFFRDLLLYFAIAIEVLLFIEWILQARDNM